VKARSAFKIRIDREEAKSAKVFILLGAQASLPASFGHPVISGNQAGKDACAPRIFTLPLLEEKS
jgi:hypothetical protein